MRLWRAFAAQTSLAKSATSQTSPTNQGTNAVHRLPLSIPNLRNTPGLETATARVAARAGNPKGCCVNFFDHSLQQNGSNEEEQNGHQAYFNSGFNIPPALAGFELAASDFTTLEARWIDGPLALAAQLRRVDSLTGAELIGRKSGNHTGVAIPYFFPGTSEVREYRLRRDHPDTEIDSKGQVKPKQKYLSPPGRGNMLYFPPGMAEAQLREVPLPLIITEGEFKTLALWRLANWNHVESARFLPFGVSGVYYWRGTIGKTNGPDGERLEVKGPIPDLERITWKGRKVIVAYDADSSQKDLVRFARAEFARHLRSRGAVVGFLEWDARQGKGICFGSAGEMCEQAAGTMDPG